MTSVKTVYIELRASAEKLRADMANAKGELATIGTAGSTAGQGIARGMDQASISVRKVAAAASEGAVALATAHSALSAAVARYGGAVATSSVNTESLVNTYRALRIALSPTPFTVAAIGAGVLTEETIRLTNARAKLIEQQSLIAAIGGTSVGAVQSLALTAAVSGGNAGALQSLSAIFAGRSQSDQGSVVSGLGILGIKGSLDDPDMLEKIARGFDSIADPAKRAAAAVQIFGADHAAEALHELNLSFIDGAEAVRKYGLVLDETSRTQIFQFRQDMLRMKEAVTNFSALGVWWENFKTGAEIVAAAAEDMAKRGAKSLDDFIARTTHLRGALAPLQTPELNPSGFGLSQGQQQGLVADDLFAQAQGSSAAAAQTLAGRQAAQAAAQSAANSAYAQLQTDQQKRQANPQDPTLLTGQQRFTLAVQQSSSAALAASIGEQVKALQDAAEAEKQAGEAAKIRVSNEISASTQAAESARQSTEIQISLAHLAAVAQIDALHDPHARAVALADADVQTAQERLAKLQPIFEKELQARIALINRQAALEGTASAQESARGQISSARSETAGRITGLQGDVSEAEARAGNARITAAREYGQEWQEVLARQAEEIDRLWKDGQQRVAEYTDATAKAELKASEIREKSSGEVNALGIGGRIQGLQGEMSNSILTLKQRAEYLTQIAALEKSEADAKAAALRSELALAAASGDVVKTAEIQAQLDQQIAESKNQQAQAQQAIQQSSALTLQQQLAAAGAQAQATAQTQQQQIGQQIGQAIGNLPQEIGDDIGGSIANALLGKHPGESIGQAMAKGLVQSLKATAASLLKQLISGGVQLGFAALGFASGGNPDPDKPFIAGEKGPEIVYPRGRALTVVPNSASFPSTRDYMRVGGGSGAEAARNQSSYGGHQVSFNDVHFHGVQDANDVVDHVMRVLPERLKTFSYQWSGANS